METPSSTRRVTRSQAISSLNSTTASNLSVSRKIEEFELGASKSRQRIVTKQDKSALFDITNDSPIVGLATGSTLSEGTPLSSIAKQRRFNLPKKSTPGSGEALLRGQVKNLLQKVEEETEISKFSLRDSSHGDDEKRPFLALKRYLSSPMGLLAPTPANTPLVMGLSGNGGTSRGIIVDGCNIDSPTEEQLTVSQVVSELFEEKNMTDVGFVDSSDKCIITRSLLLDFSDKSEISTAESSDSSSCISYQATESSKNNSNSASIDEDDASIWSIQVNASTRGEDEEDDEAEDETQEEEIYDDDDEEQGEDTLEDGMLDQLCEGMCRVCVKYTGKHTRFVYNSDDEIVEETIEHDQEEEKEGSSDVEKDCNGVAKLKGLPTPKGKHLHFQGRG